MALFESGKRKKSYLEHSFNLSALLDMFMILVIFLLSTYSSQSQLTYSVQQKAKLPKIKHKKMLDDLRPLIQVDRDQVLINKEPIIKFDESKGLTQSQKDKLDAKLKEIKSFFFSGDRNIREYDSELFIGKILLSADKDIKYDIVADVLNTCYQNGYFNIAFAISKV